MIHGHDTDDDKNVDAMDVTTSIETTTSTTTYAADGADISMNPLSEHQQNNDDENRIRKQQRQYQNLETWLQLIETAIQPLQQQNHVLLKNATNITRQSPQYTIQHGILSRNNSNNATDVVGSAMVKSTSNYFTNAYNTSSTGSSVNTTATTGTTSTILIATVTVQVGQPSIVAPKQGDITVTLSNNNNGTIGTSASHATQTIQSKIQRILDENIDLEQLHIIEGKIAYRLVVTITMLFVESMTSITLFDACLLAATAALLDTKLPTHPIISDGIVYSVPTFHYCDQTDNTLAGGTPGTISNSNKKTKPLYMPIIPISFTAIGVRLPVHISTDAQTQTFNETYRSHKNEVHWIGDPTIDEQQISDSMMVTIVMNAATVITKSEDHHLPEEENEEVLFLELTPTNSITTKIDQSLTTSTLSSNDTELSATTASPTAAVSWIDLDNVMSMAHRHVKLLHALIVPK
jgi:exosome complex RNA-binding protein Rrp42 (RNase PH superfamily)